MDNMKLMRGLALGLVAGAAVGAAAMTQRAKVARVANQAMKAVGNAAEDMMDHVNRG